MRLPNFLLRWGVFFCRRKYRLYKGLSGRYRYLSYLLPPEFGQPSNSETLGEILGKVTPYVSARFTKGSGQIYYPQKLESLYETAGQVKITVAHSENYSTKCTNEPKYVDLNVFLELHKEIMENLGQKQYVRDIGALESAFYRPQWKFYYSKAQSIPSLSRMAAGLGESVIKNLAFLDGNKRAGHLAISMFLAINDYNLVTEDASTEKITIGIATGDVNIDILESWITSNVKKRV